MEEKKVSASLNPRQRKVSIIENINPFLQRNRGDAVIEGPIKPFSREANLPISPQATLKTNHLEKGLYDTTKPNRKVSAGARLVSDLQRLKTEEVEARKRRVSFEERAYVFGQDVTPLNDVPKRNYFSPRANVFGEIDRPCIDTIQPSPESTNLNDKETIDSGHCSSSDDSITQEYDVEGKLSIDIVNGTNSPSLTRLSHESLAISLPMSERMNKDDPASSPTLKDETVSEGRTSRIRHPDRVSRNMNQNVQDYYQSNNKYSYGLQAPQRHTARPVSPTPESSLEIYQSFSSSDSEEDETYKSILTDNTSPSDVIQIRESSQTVEDEVYDSEEMEDVRDDIAIIKRLEDGLRVSPSYKNECLEEHSSHTKIANQESYGFNTDERNLRENGLLNPAFEEEEKCSVGMKPVNFTDVHQDLETRCDSELSLRTIDTEMSEDIYNDTHSSFYCGNDENGMSPEQSSYYSTGITEYEEEGPKYRRITTKNVSHVPSNSSIGSTDSARIPKPILKKRRDDSESMVSEDSVSLSAGKLPDRVKKDSIALFNDMHPDLEGLREEYESEKAKTTFKMKDIQKLWINRREYWRKNKVHVLVLVIFLSTLTFVSIAWHYHNLNQKHSAIAKKILFNPKTRSIHLADVSREDTMTGRIGGGLPSWWLPVHCSEDYEELHDRTCLKWKKDAFLNIAYFQESEIKCYNISWTILTDTTKTNDCFDFGTASWFGPSNSSEGTWPLTNSEFTFDTSITYGDSMGTLGTATDFYWFSSNGQGIVVHNSAPLQISWNKAESKAICISLNDDREYTKLGERILNYTICNGADSLHIHRFMRKKYFPRLTSLAPADSLSRQHWVVSEDGISVSPTSEKTKEVLQNIERYKLNCSTIELNGRWESKYGDFVFDEKTVLNMTELGELLNRTGCQLALTVYPYYDSFSANFQEGLLRKYYVAEYGSDVPSLVRWQYGVGAMLDVSHPEARSWVSTKVQMLIKEFSIHSIKLSYGQSAWLPKRPRFYSGIIYPNEVTNMFSNFVSTFSKTTVLSKTSHSQHLPSLISLPVEVKNTSKGRCISDIIPNALSLGLLGYPYILADGIRNSSLSIDSFLMPSKEMFIRWTQLAALFPAMKLTTFPWTYGDDGVKAVLSASESHNNIVVKCLNETQNDILDGMPIIRPLWWIDPNDENALAANDEFLVGDTYLVAPVLCEGMAARDIYVPKGFWRDMYHDDTGVQGPTWLRNYKVDLLHIPIFKKMKDYGKG
ncbi:hypothetical protein ACJMK2_015431 [Sinanodonta woodiana]|uniref:Uncharacterized protein n=1 Tax=Sinanodonta woodiana TaxID=1069815 RepID=A0ABD3UQA4_SINWO